MGVGGYLILGPFSRDYGSGIDYKAMLNRMTIMEQRKEKEKQVQSMVMVISLCCGT